MLKRFHGRTCFFNSIRSCYCCGSRCNCRSPPLWRLGKPHRCPEGGVSCFPGHANICQYWIFLGPRIMSWLQSQMLHLRMRWSKDHIKVHGLRRDLRIQLSHRSPRTSVTERDLRILALDGSRSTDQSKVYGLVSLTNGLSTDIHDDEGLNLHTLTVCGLSDSRRSADRLGCLLDWI